MPKTLKLLFIEDNKNDCDLVIEHLRDNGYAVSFERVESEDKLVQALEDNQFDVIFSDYNLPKLDVDTVIAVIQKKAPKVPIIVLSGTVSETVAVKTVKTGAKDFILKNNLTRLIPAIERELVEANTHRLHLRVEAELKKKEQELRQAQKLEAVGQLAGGVAHDFNNILAVILMQVEGAIESLDENPELKKKTASVYNSLEQIQRAGQRAANLTRQLLAFSRRQVIQPKVLDVNEVITEMGEMLSRVIEENIKLEFDLDKNCKHILVDPGHFQQILMNLVVNSRDAMPMGGKIILKTENSGIDQDVALKTNSVSGDYTLLKVIDTGLGMTEEVQKHMFDPFFTTKEVGKGTGLGLSTVYGIVKQNKGLIFADSEVNKGTTFRVYFKQADEDAPVLALESHRAKAVGGSETILVVEDENDLRELVCHSLKNSGYTVLEARDGVVALEFLKTYKKPIDLVLTDVVMPNMGGRELSEHAKGLKHKSKFLFLSGYTEDVLLQQGINSGQSQFIEKPFALKTLLNKIRDILETR